MRRQEHSAFGWAVGLVGTRCCTVTFSRNNRYAAGFPTRRVAHFVRVMLLIKSRSDPKTGAQDVSLNISLILLCKCVSQNKTHWTWIVGKLT